MSFLAGTLVLATLPIGQTVPNLPQVIQRVKPGVVSLNVRRGRSTIIGSGFIVNARGVTVTAAHVVEEADSVEAIFSDGTRRTAEVRFEDGERDYAILQLATGTYTPITLGNSDQLLEGQTVVAMGSPRGLQFTTTVGIISALRPLDLDQPLGNRKPAYIQFSAPISPGNSGGPLFDERGNVIGINIFKRRDGENLNFALAINEAKASIQRIQSGQTAPNRPAPTGPAPNRPAPNRPAPNRPGPQRPAPTPPPTASTERWIIVASRTANRWRDQKVVIIPNENLSAGQNTIQRNLDDGYRITQIAEGSKRWLVVFAKGTSYRDQLVLTAKQFPLAEIERRWKDDYYVTSCVYGAGSWNVVLSKSPDFKDQAIKVGREYDREWVRRYWDQEFTLSTLEDSDTGDTVVHIMSDLSTGREDVRFETVATLSPREIKAEAENGNYVLGVNSFGPGFLLVFGKDPGIRDQEVYYGDRFPEDWVRTQLARGYAITVLR